MTDKAKFYLVFAPTGPTPPAIVHHTHQSALAECHRLAKKNPGRAFYVMGSASRPVARTIAPAQLEAAE